MSNQKHHKGEIMPTLFTNLLEDNNLVATANDLLAEARNELHNLMQLRDDLEDEINCNEIKDPIITRLTNSMIPTLEKIDKLLYSAEKGNVYGK